MTIDYTKEEAQALLQIIDMAVRANGMQVAEAGLHFAKKIKDAADAEAAKEPAKEAE